MQNLQSFQDASILQGTRASNKCDAQVTEREYSIFDGPGFDKQGQLDALEKVADVRNKITMEVGSNYSLIGSSDYQYQTFTLGLNDYMLVVKRENSATDYYELLKSIEAESKKKQRITTDKLSDNGINFCVIVANRFQTPRIIGSQDTGDFALHRPENSNTYIISDLISIPNSDSSELTKYDSGVDPIGAFERYSYVKYLTFQNTHTNLVESAESLVTSRGGVGIQFVRRSPDGIDIQYTPELPFEIDFDDKIQEFITDALIEIVAADPDYQYVLIFKLNKILRDKKFEYKVSKSHKITTLKFQDNKLSTLSETFLPQYTLLYSQNKEMYDAILDSYISGDQEKLSCVCEGKGDALNFIDSFLRNQLKQVEGQTVDSLLTYIHAVRKLNKHSHPLEKTLCFNLQLNSEEFKRFGLNKYTSFIIEEFNASKGSEDFVLLNTLYTHQKKDQFFQLLEYYVQLMEQTGNMTQINTMLHYPAYLNMNQDDAEKYREIVFSSFLVLSEDTILDESKVRRYFDKYDCTMTNIEAFCSFHKVSIQELLQHIKLEDLELDTCFALVDKTTDQKHLSRLIDRIAEVTKADTKESYFANIQNILHYTSQTTLEVTNKEKLKKLLGNLYYELVLLIDGSKNVDLLNRLIETTKLVISFDNLYFLTNTLISKLNQSLYKPAPSEFTLEKYIRFQRMFIITKEYAKWFANTHLTHISGADSKMEYILENTYLHRLDCVDFIQEHATRGNPSAEYAPRIEDGLGQLKKEDVLNDINVFKFVFESLRLRYGHSQKAFSQLSKVHPYADMLPECVDFLVERGVSIVDIIISANCKRSEINDLLETYLLGRKLSLLDIKELINHANYFNEELMLEQVEEYFSLDTNIEDDFDLSEVRIGYVNNAIFIHNLPSDLEVDDEQLTKFQTELNRFSSTDKVKSHIFAYVLNKILIRCVKRKPLTRWQKAQSAIFKAAEVLNPANLVSKTVSTVSRHTSNNKWRYLGAAGTMVALGVGYYLLKDNTGFESVSLESSVTETHSFGSLSGDLDTSSIPNLSSVHVLSDPLSYDIVFDSIAQISGQVDIELPANINTDHLLSGIYEVSGNEVSIPDSLYKEVEPNSILQVATNGGDLIVRNQNGTFRELFQGVSEYALELQNNTQVTATGNSEMMQFTVDGQSKAIIYHEVTLPNGQTGYLSGINLTKVQQ